MALRRPRFLFDVHIGSYVQNGTIARSDWELVRRYMARHARYAITSITLYELIAGIAHGSNAHFHHNREPLRILFEPAGRELLPLSGDFVRSMVFNLPIRAKAFQSKKLEKWVTVILKAQSKADLLGGRVKLKGESYGSPLSSFATQIQRGKRLDAERFERLRKGQLRESTQETWCRELLKRMEVPPIAENIDKLKEPLDAAWCFERERYKLARDKGYNFERHGSDWLDGQLLYYLADAQMHVVSSDRRIKHLTRGSQQSRRILDFDDLIATARIARP
jgi:hypothetical protein